MDARFERFLSTLCDESKRTSYRKRVGEYLTYCDEQSLNSADPMSLDAYITMLHDDENFEYAASTLWTITSMISTWFENVHHIVVKMECKLIQKKLKNWEKNEECKKALTFSRDNIQKILNDYPEVDGGILKKVVVVMGIYGLLRCCEIIQLKFSDLKFNPDCIMVTVDRHKQVGPKRVFEFAITDTTSMGIISRYVHLFPEKAKTEGRLLRQIRQGAPIVQPVGENTIGKYTIGLADWLGLAEPKRYTAHSLRRSGATILAESGCSLPMLKIAGGWASSTVAEGYINTSKRTLKQLGNALAIGSGPDLTVSAMEEPEDVPLPAKKRKSGEMVSYGGAAPGMVINNPTGCTFYFGIPAPSMQFPAQFAPQVASEVTKSSVNNAGPVTRNIHKRK